MSERFVPVPVLYRDDALFVVSKPSGLAVHRGWARERETLLSLARRIARQHVYPCHRLDRGTSGVMLFALDSELATKVQRQFEAQTIRKRYLAWVRGASPPEGLVDHAIAKEPGAVKRQARTAIQRLATTEFPNPRAPQYPLRYSLTVALPLSGRLHQIRRHLKHLSHPIIGDTKYGKSEHNRYCSAEFGLERMALHAAQLVLRHPVSGELLSITAPIPEDLMGPLTRVGMADAALGALDAPWDPKIELLPALGL